MKPQMTLTEKILSRAANKNAVKPDEIVEVNVDYCMTNDATTHISIDLFYKEIANKTIARPDRTILVIDHNVPSESVKSTAVHNKMRHFAKRHNLILHDGEGVCHQLLLEKYVLPWQIVVAADSHTCSHGSLGAFGTGFGSTDFVAAMVTGKTWLMVPRTLRFNLSGKLNKGLTARDIILKIIGDIGSDGANYMSMEFGGPGMENLTISERTVLCNLSVEAGAKNGIVETDEITRQYLNRMRQGVQDYPDLTSDPDCRYEKTFNYDLSQIQPSISGPDFLHNYDTVANAKGLKINQGFIGSCNNGRIEDLRLAADILKRRRIKPDVKLLISPASQDTYLAALKEGLIETFLTSGAIVMNPNCSVCWGGCQGVIGENEVLLSTGTRNFKGRAGHPESKIFLASAATVAASCIEGKVVEPMDYITQ